MVHMVQPAATGHILTVTVGGAGRSEVEKTRQYHRKGSLSSSPGSPKCAEYRHVSAFYVVLFLGSKDSVVMLLSLSSK
jgi:hypothetical protein